MKKVFAVFAACVLIILSGCSKNPVNSPTNVDGSSVSVSGVSGNAAPTAPQATQNNSPQEGSSEGTTSSGWDRSLLPDNFPSPPDSLSLCSTKVTYGDGDRHLDGVTVTTLTFNCTKPDFIKFSNDMTAIGYEGGFIHMTDNGSYYIGGFHGGWHDKNNLVTIGNCIELEEQEFTIVLEIIDISNTYVDGLDELFPLFTYGASINSGICAYYDYETGDYEFNSAAADDLSEKGWVIMQTSNDFNSFYGVTDNELTEYCNELYSAGFSVSADIVEIDSCQHKTVYAEKADGDTTLIVSVVYNVMADFADILYCRY